MFYDNTLQMALFDDENEGVKSPKLTPNLLTSTQLLQILLVRLLQLRFLRMTNLVSRS